VDLAMLALLRKHARCDIPQRLLLRDSPPRGICHKQLIAKQHAWPPQLKGVSVGGDLLRFTSTQLLMIETRGER
jgi:hypothetical protein